ncbi:membrane hypothetical protein [Vibrio chagasii]|nr:membrane hypothetical protein [Vibrio chagasii]
MEEVKVANNAGGTPPAQTELVMKNNTQEHAKRLLIIIIGITFTAAFCLTTIHTPLHITFSIVGALVFGNCAYHRDDTIAFICSVPMMVGFSFIVKAMEVTHRNSAPALTFGSLFLIIAIWIAFDRENFRPPNTH